MALRTLSLALSCGLLGFGGYQVSHLRAGHPSPPFSEVLAAAGGDNGLSLVQDGAEGGQGYRISSLNVFSNVALQVTDNYVEPERIDPKEMLVAALNEIEKQVAEVMVEGVGQGRLRIRVMEKEKIVHIDDVESLWEINLKLRNVFRFLEKELPKQDDYRAIEYAAVNGALSTLDPHSLLLKPEAFQEMKTSTKGEFGGLGIVISIRENKLTIISPLDDTPAARAGLEAGDRITRIGSVSTVSMPIEEAVQMLRGPRGSKVSIWVLRKGWPDARRFIITRERIKLQSVESELLSNRVGYIKIKNFQANTGKDLEDKLEGLEEKANGKLAGLVLDLRNNPGGLLEQAIRVSDSFIAKGNIVTTVGYGNRLRDPKQATVENTRRDLPIAVLVNKGSASASEIVAGALKNLNRAVIVGERTFGKGSVQVLYDFADNSALKLTIAQYLTPGDVSIQNEGVIPDIALSPAWIEDRGVRLFYRPEGHREKNLDKHLERPNDVKAKRAMKNPSFRLTYLVEQTNSDEEVQPGFREDYPTQFARRLLLEAGDAKRSSVLKRGRSFMETRDLEQQKKIRDRLAEYKINWDAKDAASPGLPAVEANIELVGVKDAVKAGDEVAIRAVVRNTGDVPLVQLRGLLESEHPAFKGRELMFGRVEPGQSREWTVKTRIPKDSSSRSDLLGLELTAARGELGQASTIAVLTRRVGHPQFAYQFVLDDRERGDGDGILELGEGIDFTVLVTNNGKGAADDVSLRLKSGAKEDLFLERGRASIGKIEAGETKASKLRFRVPTAQSNRGTLPLELTIYDSGTNEWMEDQIDLKYAVSKQPDKVAKRKGSATMKTDARLYSGANTDTPVLATLSKGSKVAVSGKLKDMLRVEVAADVFAWVSARDVRYSARSARKPDFAKVAFAPSRQTPTITLQDNPGGTVVDQEMARLSGVVSGEQLRDMYVLLNDEKIFFKGSPVAAAPATDAKATAADWKAPNHEAAKLKFDVGLPLKPGLNKILLVARRNEKVISYRNLFVSRRVASLPVAKAPNQRTPNTPR